MPLAGLQRATPVAKARLRVKPSHAPAVASRPPTPTFHPFVQAKLHIGAPNDKYEQEADRVAEEVMRMPDSQLQGGACEPGQGREHLKITRVQANDSGKTVAPPIVTRVLSSPGRPIDSATTAFFEQRFGRDFSQVRVHSDTTALASAQSIDARAYTAGREIVFGRGHYMPETREGRRLLAHELTHVVQQGASTAQGAVHAERIQKGEVSFAGCTENGHELDSFRLIPEDKDEKMFPPEDGVEHDDIDGFLWRWAKGYWYKISDFCEAKVSCSVDDEGNQWINPSGKCASWCPDVTELLGKECVTEWRGIDSVPEPGKSNPWPD